MPAFLVHGNPDSHHMGEPLRAAMRARFVPLAGCGHWWPVARPADTAAALWELWEAPGG